MKKIILILLSATLLNARAYFARVEPIEIYHIKASVNAPVIDINRELDVTTVSHTHAVKDFIAKGRDLERIVLSRAVQLHVARKTMVYNNKTVIFS